MVLQEPDYVELWRSLVLRGGGRFGSYFEIKEKAADYHAASRRKNNARRDVLLEGMKDSLQAGDTVLDIGAGTGRWAVELAKVAERVTAVEPAGAMSDILMANARDAGVAGKIDLVSAVWEKAEVGTHDIVVSAHAIYMSADFAAFIHKMESHAKKRCYLGIRHLPIDGIIQELSTTIYGTRHDSPNFIIAYNALYQMGIYANVTIEESRHNWSNDTVEAALERAKRHLHLENDRQYDDMILAALKRRLAFKNGLYHWPDCMTTALVSWNVHSDQQSVA